MPSLILSPEAEQDLLDIWLYIAEDSPVNAEHFLDRLEAKAIKLSEFPEIGVERSEIARNLKSFPVDRYVLYYRVTTDGIELVRVLHAMRDVNRVF